MALIIEESRITSKGQTTVPKAVRQALGVGVGDAIAFRIEDDGVRVERVATPGSIDPLDAFLTFLAGDIAHRPEAVRALTPEFRARIAKLTEGVSVDFDEPIDGKIAL
jgi:antitoxin PrlF